MNNIDELHKTSSVVTVQVPNGSLRDNKWTIKDGARLSPAGNRRYVTVVPAQPSLTCRPARRLVASLLLQQHAAHYEASHGLLRSVIKARRMTRQ